MPVFLQPDFCSKYYLSYNHYNLSNMHSLFQKITFYLFFTSIWLFCSLPSSVKAQENGPTIKAKKVEKKKAANREKDRNAATFMGKGGGSEVIERKDQGSTYSGDTPLRKYRKYKRRNVKDKAAEMANFSGNIRYGNPEKLKSKRAKATSEYSGSILARKVRKYQKRGKKDKAAEIANFSGNIRFVNIFAKRQKKARKMASYLGPNPIRVRRKPKGAMISKFRGVPNSNKRRVANYNRKRFKSGRKVKKSELPNYQKNKPAKIKYNSREAKWNLKKLEEHTQKLPKNNKSKAKKARKAEERKQLEKEKAGGSGK